MRVTIDVSTVESASFPQRILARMIDNIIVFLLFLAFLSLVGQHLDLDSKHIDPNLGIGNLIWFLPLFYLGYEVPTLAMNGLTLGKRIMGICVVRTDGLIGIGLDRALLRVVIPMVLSFLFIVGPILYLGAQTWFFFDPNRQNVPDKIARTFVIRIPRASEDDIPSSDAQDE